MRCLRVSVIPFLVILLAACDDGGSSSASTSTNTGTTYAIGGTVSGLTAAGLVLQNNGGDNLQVNAGATGFTFLTHQADATPYNVTVSASPTGLGCSVTNGSGVVAAANVTNVQITCIPKNDLASRSSDDTLFAGYYGDLLGFHSMSSDGRYVAFEASVTGLASGSTTASGKQIFLRDRITNQTTLISRASGASGAEGNNASYEPSVSVDGRYVVFYSYASNLVSGDMAGFADVFLRDTQTQTTTRLSVGTNGVEANGASDDATISADGRYVAFHSYATNLTVGNYGYLYLRDMQTGAITPIDLAFDGSKPDGGGNKPVPSADGSRIAFWSYASNLVQGDTNGIWDVFVYNRTTGTTTLVSVATDGTQKNQGSESASRIVRPAISGDGNVVAFSTTATNLVANDTNGLQDVFVRNLSAGTTIRASVSSGGNQGNGASPIAQGERVALSYDGTWVTFTTVATNIAAGATSGQSVVLHNTTTGATSTVTHSSTGFSGTYGTSISGDGRYAGFLSSEYLDPRFPSNSGLFVQDRNVP